MMPVVGGLYTVGRSCIKGTGGGGDGVAEVDWRLS